MEYRIGKLELENMELEQSRTVHDSISRGKDLTIQKLKLQLRVSRDCVFIDFIRELMLMSTLVT